MDQEVLYRNKYLERDVDLSVNGWRFATNVDLEEVREGFQRVKEKEILGFSESYEICLLKPAYYLMPEDKILEGGFAVYSKNYGNGAGNYIPPDLVREAKHFLRLRKKGKPLAERFLLDVYSQVVKGRNGLYKNKVDREEQSVGAILNYFSDKLRGFGRLVESSKLEIETKKRVHVKTLDEHLEELRKIREKEDIEDSLGKDVLKMDGGEYNDYMQRRRERSLGKLSNL